MLAPNGTAKRLGDVGLIALFIGAISLPSLKTLWEPRPTVSTQEGRVLAPPPELKPTQLDRFPGQFDAYFNDCFGFRTNLIGWLAAARVNGLRVSSSPHVIMGKKGWLYHGDESYVTNYRNTQPFTFEELEQWRVLLEARQEWLAQRGIRYLVIIAPEKPTIYPEYLPRGINRVRPDSRLDQFLAHMRTHAKLDVLDLRPVLQAAKANEQVYYKKDTHWNWRGAFAAYQQVTSALAAWFPQVRGLPRTAFTTVSLPKPDCNLARMLGPVIASREPDLFLDLGPRRQAHPAKVPYSIDEAYRHPDAPVAREGPNPALPRAVMFHDSFTYHMLDFLAEHFSRIAFFMQNFPQFDPRTIEREHPQVVLQEMVEWKLILPITSNPPELKSRLVVSQ
jgi:hypothetical protein